MNENSPFSSKNNLTLHQEHQDKLKKHFSNDGTDKIITFLRNFTNVQDVFRFFEFKNF